MISSFGAQISCPTLKKGEKNQVKMAASVLVNHNQLTKAAVRCKEIRRMMR